MSKFDRYALDSPRANPRSDGTAGGSGGPLWREVDGLLQKGFPAPPAKKDSKYPDPVYYLPYTPELDLDAENVRITPPKANENYLATTYIIDVGRQAMGISTIVPWDLRHLPVSAADFDSSIENSISPTKMNSNETGGLRWARKYFLLVMRVDGDRDPNPSVLMLGAQQMHDLCTQLATYRKFIPDIAGVPLTITSVNSTVTVDAMVDEPKLDMSLLEYKDSDGVLTLNKYLWTVRDEYEKFLLDHGYECETSEDGQRYAWRQPSTQKTADEEPPPWDAATDSPPLADSKKFTANLDEFEDYTKDQLRELIDIAGLDVPARATRDQLIEAIVAAR